LRRLWDDLAGADAAKAYEAIWALAQSPKTTLPFLHAQLPAAVAPDPGKVAQLMADLSSERFPVRNRATQELENLGELAESALKEAVSKSQSLESRQRIQALLNNLQGPIASPGKHREVRAVEILESIGTEQARRVLEKLAGGAPAARLTQEAKDSLTRLR
jgi:hypothetical protein